MASAIERTDLRKHSDTVVGVDAVDPVVVTDEISGLLGPTDAAGSTTVTLPDVVHSNSWTASGQGADAPADSQE